MPKKLGRKSTLLVFFEICSLGFFLPSVCLRKFYVLLKMEKIRHLWVQDCKNTRFLQKLWEIYLAIFRYKTDIFYISCDIVLFFMVV